MKEFGYSEQVCDFSVRGVQVWHFWFMHYLRSGMGHKRRECVSDPRHVDGVSHVKMGSVCVLGVADAILSSNTLSGPVRGRTMQWEQRLSCLRSAEDLC